MKEKIKYFEMWLDNLHPPEVWGCFYGEHRHKRGSKTTVGRWFFVAGYGTPTWRYDEFDRLVLPVARGKGLLDLPREHWNRKWKAFLFSPVKPKWKGIDQNGEPWQLYGMSVPKVKGDYLKMIMKPAPTLWVRWAMKVP